MISAEPSPVTSAKMGSPRKSIPCRVAGNPGRADPPVAGYTPSYSLMAPPLFDWSNALASDVAPVSACANVMTPFTLPNAPEVVNAVGMSPFGDGGHDGVAPYVAWIWPAPLSRYGGLRTGPVAMRSGPFPDPVTSASAGAAFPSVMNSCADP